MEKVRLSRSVRKETYKKIVIATKINNLTFWSFLKMVDGH